MIEKTIQEQLRLVQIEILDEIARICEGNGLRYCLTGGTCLGAVRHKGYIPWDDDIDIIMPRKDYQKFIEITTTKDSGDFFLDYYITNPTYGRSFAKFCKKNTLFIEPNGLKQSIYVDVFYLDKVPGPEFTASSKLPGFIHKLDALTTVRREGLEGRDLKTRLIYYATRWIPVKWLFKWGIRLMTRFENTDSQYYINYGSPYNLVKETIKISDYEPYVQLPFEGKMYNVPRNWNLYLSNIYGDYMVLPPENKRITHYPQFVSVDTTQDINHYHTLNKKHFCFASSFAAPYAGGFILMLKALAEMLVEEYDAKVFFIFPKQKESPWLKELSSRYEVAFVDAFSEESPAQICQLFDKWQIDLVHSHFESYDIPVAKAVAKSKRKIKQVWHLHDCVELEKKGRLKLLKKFKTGLSYWLHYKYYGRHAYLIGVSPEVLFTIEQFKESILRYPRTATIEELSNMTFLSGEVVLNGIDCSRISGKYIRPSGKFVFLSFGSFITRKGIPTLLAAAEQLEKDGYDFEVLLTRGPYLDKYLKNLYSNGNPEWLAVVGQSDDIASIFDSSSCFVSAAIAETMSLAVAEASIYGLPVIQSDIPGTWWNASNPSSFIFKKGNVADLCQKMKDIIDMDPTELEKLCGISRWNNRKMLSLEGWCHKMIKIYSSLK